MISYHTDCASAIGQVEKLIRIGIRLHYKPLALPVASMSSTFFKFLHSLGCLEMFVNHESPLSIPSSSSMLIQMRAKLLHHLLYFIRKQLRKLLRDLPGNRLC